jgi:hypothetical protein
MSDPRRYDEPERLNAEQASELQARLSTVGPWMLLIGTGGILRAERGGTRKHEQAALTGDALLQAVTETEGRIEELNKPTPVTGGLGATGTQEVRRV